MIGDHFLLPTILLITSFILPTSLLAESVIRAPERTFEGTIEEKNWSKSVESYCHGGSEYLVLKTEKETLTLGSERVKTPFRYSLTELKSFKDKNVIVRGAIVTLSQNQDEHCPPPSQCVSGGIDCSFIEVLDIKVLNKKGE